MTRLLLIALLLINSPYLYAQLEPYLKYEAVSAKDFSLNGPFGDTSSHAIILHDIGSTDFEVNDQGDFTMIFKQHRRILIRNSSAYDLGTFGIRVFTGNSYYSEEKIENLEASTFNLVNSKVEETKLEKSSIFKIKFNKQVNIMKYALTNIKVGSIIEYSYTIKSPFFHHLRSWDFQSNYPCLWSEYQVMIPPIFSYFTIKKGLNPYSFDSSWQGNKILTPMETFNSTLKYSMNGKSRYAIWVMKNIPSFQEQDFISSDKNYINRIEFQLDQINYRNRIIYTMLNWPETANALLEQEELWNDLTKSNPWLSGFKKQISDSLNDYDKAKKIFEFVRDNYKCNNHNDIIPSKDLKETYKSKEGNVADINLLLTAMLTKMGFDAHPVILSTRKNGLPDANNAILGQYNYVLSRIKIKNNFYLLDASDPHLGFGRLNTFCYNNIVRVIDKIPILIDLSPDSIQEKKSTIISLQNDRGDLGGKAKLYLSYFESIYLRDQLQKNKEYDYKRNLTKLTSPDISIQNVSLDSLNNYDEPIVVNFDIKVNLNNADHLYFNPVIAGARKSNPFVASSRLYPIELNSLTSDIYTLSMDIPKGYVVEEMPKSASIKLNEKDGSYDYLISNDGEKIQFRSVLKINKTTFPVEEYQNLRDFYGYIIKKQEEMIVFKKNN